LSPEIRPYFHELICVTWPSHRPFIALPPLPRASSRCPDVCPGFVRSRNWPSLIMSVSRLESASLPSLLRLSIFSPPHRSQLLPKSLNPTSNALPAPPIARSGRKIYGLCGLVDRGTAFICDDPYRSFRSDDNAATTEKKPGENENHFSSRRPVGLLKGQWTDIAPLATTSGQTKPCWGFECPALIPNAAKRSYSAWPRLCFGTKRPNCGDREPGACFSRAKT